MLQVLDIHGPFQSMIHGDREVGKVTQTNFIDFVKKEANKIFDTSFLPEVVESNPVCAIRSSAKKIRK